jgi:hypothetical protein
MSEISGERTASTTRLCGHSRAEDDAQCVFNAHPEHPERHAFTYPVDVRLGLLDALATTFRNAEQWAAYYHVRAVAHDLGFHLSSCVHGLRAVPYARAATAAKPEGGAS